MLGEEGSQVTQPRRRDVGPGVGRPSLQSAEMLLPWNWFLGVTAGPPGSDPVAEGVVVGVGGR